MLIRKRFSEFVKLRVLKGRRGGGLLVFFGFVWF